MWDMYISNLAPRWTQDFYADVLRVGGENLNFGYLPAKTVANEFATSKPREFLSIRALSIPLFAKCIFCQKFQPSYHFPTYHLLFGTSLWCFQVYIRRRCTAGKKGCLASNCLLRRHATLVVSTSSVKDPMPCHVKQQVVTAHRQRWHANCLYCTAQTGRTGKVLPQVCFIAHPQLSGTQGLVHGDS